MINAIGRIATGLTKPLVFVPTGGLCLDVGVDKDDDRERMVLKGEVRQKPWEFSVKLSTEEDFESLKGNLKLVDARSKTASEDGCIGWLEYGDGSYTVEVEIPTRRFDALLAAVSQQRLPSEIFIDVKGLLREGVRDLKWDNKSSPEIPILSISFSLPLSPTHAQFDTLLARVDRMTLNSNRIVVGLISLIGLLLYLVFLR